MEAPFIKLLRTPRGWYVYDVGKDSLLKIGKDLYEALATSDSDSLKRLTEDVRRDLRELMDMGYFSSKRPQVLRHPNTDILETLLDRKIEKLTLQLTQDCNFRCKYCIYSEEINHKQRHHSQKHMSWEIAKASIDFYREHSPDADGWNIGFYGGEPLLEFELLQRCVNYAESELKGKPLAFTITTNASLLKDSVVEFLKEHDVNVLVSLDGSSETHNRNRVFRNGEGTYPVIIRNLTEIREMYPDYFEKIHYNMVVDCEAGIHGYQGVLEDLGVDSEHINATLIENIDEPRKLSADFIHDIEYLKFIALYENSAGIPYSGYSLSTSTITEAKHRIETHDSLNGIGNIVYPGGQCIPGKTRLFVNADGEMYPCERVNETQFMRIGYINDGFDIEQIKQLLNVATITENQCKNCWAFHLCTSCIKLSDSGNGLSAATRLSHCSEIRNAAFETLRTIVCLWECEAIYADDLIRLKKENQHAESKC